MAAKPIVVIGAGAAGLLAAWFAARSGAPVLLVERTRQGGKKIVVSGGGRCNVLPSAVDGQRYVTDSSPNLLRRMLLAWPLADQRRFFEDEVGLRLELEPETGKLFPASNDAREVRDRLVDGCRRAGAALRFETLVTALAPAEAGWRVTLDGTERVEAAAVVVATGGLSVPKTGSDGAGLRWAARLGHTVHPTYPALTPLTADGGPHAELSGVSLTAEVTAGAGKHRLTTAGGFLFTHRGYSGPSVLDVSHLATRAADGPTGGRPPITVRWTTADAAAWDARLREDGAGLVATLLRAELPTRLADRLMRDAGVPDARARAELRRDERQRLVQALTRYPLPWTGDEGYKKAEVTGGGVALNEVHPATLESRLHPGLFWCGEVLDAFGPIGGYNFLWAWATGRTAGLGAAAAVQPA